MFSLSFVQLLEIKSNHISNHYLLVSTTVFDHLFMVYSKSISRSSKLIQQGNSGKGDGEDLCQSLSSCWHASEISELNFGSELAALGLFSRFWNPLYPYILSSAAIVIIANKGVRVSCLEVSSTSPVGWCTWWRLGSTAAHAFAVCGNCVGACIR